MGEQNEASPPDGISFHQKTSEVLILATAWMNLGNVTLSERSQTHKATTACSLSYESPKASRCIETESRLVVARGWRRSRNGVIRSEVRHEQPGEAWLKGMQADL